MPSNNELRDQLLFRLGLQPGTTEYNNASTSILVMQDAGFSADEINEVVSKQVGQSEEIGGREPLLSEGITPLREWQRAAEVILPAAGGIIGAGLAARQGLLRQGLAETAGIFAGDVAGRAVAGEEQNLKESAWTSALGGGIGTAFRGAARLLSVGLGNVSPASAREAGRPTMRPRVPGTDIKLISPVPLPAVGKVTTGGFPGMTAQLRGEGPWTKIENRTREAVKRVTKSGKISMERARKVELLTQADDQGVRIDPRKIADAIGKGYIEPDAAITSEAKALNNKIEDTVRDVLSKGDLRPTTVDQMISKVFDESAYTSSGKPVDNLFASSLRRGREAAVEALDEALPEGRIRELNKKISERLTEWERIERLYGPDRQSTINNLRSAFTEGGEERRRALYFLSRESGDRSLHNDAWRTFTKLDFGTDLMSKSEMGAVGKSRAGFTVPGRVAGRVLAPFQSFVGGGAAGVQKYYATTPSALETPLTDRDKLKLMELESLAQ